MANNFEFATLLGLIWVKRLDLIGITFDFLNGFHLKRVRIRGCTPTSHVTIEQSEVNLNEFGRSGCLFLVLVYDTLRLWHRLSAVCRRYLQLRNGVRTCVFMHLFLFLMTWLGYIFSWSDRLLWKQLGPTYSQVLDAETWFKLISLG